MERKWSTLLHCRLIPPTPSSRGDSCLHTACNVKSWISFCLKEIVGSLPHLGAVLWWWGRGRGRLGCSTAWVELHRELRPGVGVAVTVVAVSMEKLLMSADLPWS